MIKNIVQYTALLIMIVLCWSCSPALNDRQDRVKNRVEADSLAGVKGKKKVRRTVTKPKKKIEDFALFLSNSQDLKSS